MADAEARIQSFILKKSIYILEHHFYKEERHE